jgi:hypothetical protein
VLGLATSFGSFSQYHLDPKELAHDKFISGWK